MRPKNSLSLQRQKTNDARSLTSEYKMWMKAPHERNYIISAGRLAGIVLRGIDGALPVNKSKEAPLNPPNGWRTGGVTSDYKVYYKK